MIDAMLGKTGVVDPEYLQREFDDLLVEGETYEIGFGALDQTVTFTNLRLLVADFEGKFKRNIELASVPYSKITRFSIRGKGDFRLDLVSRNQGLDFSTDLSLDIWVDGSEDPLVCLLPDGTDILGLQKILAAHVLM